MATRFLLVQVDRYLDECDRSMRAATVQGLAEYVCLTPKELARQCLSETGLSTCDLLRTRQLERARHYLLDTDLTVQVIAMCCGFGTERTFYRTFRSVEGMTPKQFRAKFGSA